MIRTVKKMIGDRLRHYKTKTWVEVLKPSLNRYHNQVHSSTKTTPNNAHNLDTVIQVRTNLILKEKHNRKYPNISEGDYVKIFDKGKGNYVSRKETRSQWSERKSNTNYFWLISNCVCSSVFAFLFFGISLLLLSYCFPVPFSIPLRFVTTCVLNFTAFLFFMIFPFIVIVMLFVFFLYFFVRGDALLWHRNFPF